MELRDLPSVDVLGREAGHPPALDQRVAVLDAPAGRSRPAPIRAISTARLGAELAGRPRGRAAPRGQRDRRHRPHEPRPRAARRGGARARRRGRRAATPTSRYDLDRARAARGRITSRRSAPADRRRGRARRQQQRRRGAARARGARRRPRGGRLARRADRNRRRLPHPRRARASGARLVEVGTTNRTRAGDYERGDRPATALLLRVHQSNFRVVGFTEQPAARELAAVARRHSLPLVDDLGSGALADRRRRAVRARGARRRRRSRLLLRRQAARRPAGRDRRRPRRPRRAAPPASAAARAAGRQAPLAALEGTLRSTSSGARAARGAGAAHARARPPRPCAYAPSAWPSLTGGEVEETVGRVGGGALPLAELPSFACAIEEQLAEPLRRGEPPVVGIVRDGRLLLDCRTLTDAEADEVAAAVARARA